MWSVSVGNAAMVEFQGEYGREERQPWGIIARGGCGHGGMWSWKNVAVGDVAVGKVAMAAFPPYPV